MQYFIGISLPSEISQKIISFQKSFQNNKLPLMAEPHITVKAQGGLSEDLTWIPRIKHAIKSIQPFEVSFVRVGGFGENVVFLEPSSNGEVEELHRKLFNAVSPGTDVAQAYYEADSYRAHLTLSGSSWGMTNEELGLLRTRAVSELSNLPKFKVSFVRIYVQKNPDGPYHQFLDVPLGE